MRINTYSTVLNLHDEKEYFISTEDWKKTLDLKFTNGKHVELEILFQSLVVLDKSKTMTFDDWIKYASKPILVINLVSFLNISKEEFHQLVCKLVKDEKITALVKQNIYLKYGYKAMEQTIWSIYTKGDIKHIFICGIL